MLHGFRRPESGCPSAQVPADFVAELREPLCQFVAFRQPQPAPFHRKIRCLRFRIRRTHRALAASQRTLVAVPDLFVRSMKHDFTSDEYSRATESTTAAQLEGAGR